MSRRKSPSRKPVVLLTDRFFPDLIQSLRPHVRILYAEDRAELLQKIRAADALMCRTSDRIDQELLSHAEHLQVVASFGVGTDHIDFDACRRYGIRVTNTPDVLSRATAELALTLLLAAARRVPEGEELCRSGNFIGLRPQMLLGLQLEGRRAVIVGPGRIGKETARLFQAVGLEVEFIGRSDSAASILRKLRRAQVVSLHFPLTAETRHWLNRERISMLPPDAIVINTSRGPTIDERALIAALRAGKIFAAGLDVYEREPLIPAALRALPNVVLLPHIGSATRETRYAMARMTIAGLLGILSGKAPANEVRF